jgi:hypothetical protein
MQLKHIALGATLCMLPACPLQAQPRGIDGMPLAMVPAVVIVGQSDARVGLVQAAVAHWNSLLAGLGSGFRLGRVSQGGASTSGEPGKIVVVLSDGVFVSHVNRLPGGRGAVAMIRNDKSPPTSLPNVMRNVIAHELGHTIGLGHNADPAMLMCGRPNPCRPGLFASQSAHYFPLSAAERAKLLAMYPAGWKGQ